MFGMARTPRFTSPLGRHHVFNRVARREFFLEPTDVKRIFLDVLASLPGRHGVRVHGYALMSNHFHLMLETPGANLSRSVQDAMARFTQGVNRLKGWDGPIFRGRFGSRPVFSEDQWRYLLAYVHLNPVHAGLAKAPELYKWSSSRAYRGSTPTPSWLTTAGLIESHCGLEPLLAYESTVHLGYAPDHAELVVDCLKHPKPKCPPPTTDLAMVVEPPHKTILRVASTMGVSLGAIQTQRFGSLPNVERWVAARELTKNGRMSHRQAARILGCSPNSISKMMMNLRRRLESHPDLRHTLAVLDV